MAKEYGLTVVIALVIIFIGTIFLRSCDAKKYNEGVCKCGGHYEYQQAVGHRRSTTYIYKCNKCGNLIELYSYINEE
jgi:hypothetical protein